MKNFTELFARNIVNNDVVKEYLKKLFKNIYKPEIKKWINSNLKNYIQEDLDTVKKVTKYKENDPDWLKKGVEEGTALEVEFNESFKDKVTLILQYFESDDVELNKLYKIDFDIAFYKASLWSKKVEEDNKKKLAEIPEDFTGIEVVREYDDGFKWVRLSTQKALNREGHLMNHCTKDEEQGYLQGIKSGILEIFSLRDEKNIPHCTMEVRKTEIKQIKGYSNGAIREQYVEKVKNFIQKPIKGRRFEKIEDLINLGYIEQGGKWHNIYNLQPGFIIEDTLDLRGTTIEKLPKNLTIDGHLVLTGVKTINELPENLTITKELYIKNTNIKFLPKNLKVEELNLPGTYITELPENLEVEYLDLTGTNIEFLPKNLKVKFLNLYGSKITELPENLEVKELTLSKTNIEFLPKDLKVKSLDLSDSKIKELPDNLKVEYLDLTDSKIKELPENLEVGDLFLSKSDIEFLPNTLKVTGKLYLSDSKITELPENLEVKNLELYKTNITKLPKNLKVTSMLDVSYSKITELPENLELKTLNVNGKNITKLPKKLKADVIHLDNSKIKELPDDLKARKIYGNKLIKKIPKGVKKYIVV